MKIAFLGWGSLIWDPRELRIKGDWHEDGPSLPIEFRRYSKGGRITLVLCPGTERVRTLWAHADFKEIAEARENLRVREGTPDIDRIGYTTKNDCVCKAAPEILEDIRAWASEKGLDAVVWTDLSENPDRFLKETGMELNDDNIIRYLESLEGEALKQAREYVQKAPGQINTHLRARIDEVF